MESGLLYWARASTDYGFLKINRASIFEALWLAV